MSPQPKTPVVAAAQPGSMAKVLFGNGIDESLTSATSSSSSSVAVFSPRRGKTETDAAQRQHAQLLNFTQDDNGVLEMRCGSSVDGWLSRMKKGEVEKAREARGGEMRLLVRVEKDGQWEERHATVLLTKAEIRNVRHFLGQATAAVGNDEDEQDEEEEEEEGGTDEFEDEEEARDDRAAEASIPFADNLSHAMHTNIRLAARMIDADALWPVQIGALLQEHGIVNARAFFKELRAPSSAFLMEMNEEEREAFTIVMRWRRRAGRNTIIGRTVRFAARLRFPHWHQGGQSRRERREENDRVQVWMRTTFSQLALAGIATVDAVLAVPVHVMNAVEALPMRGGGLSLIDIYWIKVSAGFLIRTLRMPLPPALVTLDSLVASADIGNSAAALQAALLGQRPDEAAIAEETRDWDEKRRWIVRAHDLFATWAGPFWAPSPPEAIAMLASIPGARCPGDPEAFVNSLIFAHLHMIDPWCRSLAMVLSELELEGWGSAMTAARWFWRAAGERGTVSAPVLLNRWACYGNDVPPTAAYVHEVLRRTDASTSRTTEVDDAAEFLRRLALERRDVEHWGDKLLHTPPIYGCLAAEQTRTANTLCVDAVMPMLTNAKARNVGVLQVELFIDGIGLGALPRAAPGWSMHIQGDERAPVKGQWRLTVREDDDDDESDSDDADFAADDDAFFGLADSDDSDSDSDDDDDDDDDGSDEQDDGSGSSDSSSDSSPSSSSSSSSSSWSSASSSSSSSSSSAFGRAYVPRSISSSKRLVLRSPLLPVELLLRQLLLVTTAIQDAKRSATEPMSTSTVTDGEAAAEQTAPVFRVNRVRAGCIGRSGHKARVASLWAGHKNGFRLLAGLPVDKDFDAIRAIKKVNKALRADGDVFDAANGDDEDVTMTPAASRTFVVAVPGGRGGDVIEAAMWTLLVLDFIRSAERGTATEIPNEDDTSPAAHLLRVVNDAQLEGYWATHMVGGGLRSSRWAMTRSAQRVPDEAAAKSSKKSGRSRNKTPVKGRVIKKKSKKAKRGKTKSSSKARASASRKTKKEVPDESSLPVAPKKKVRRAGRKDPRIRFRERLKAKK